MSKSYIDLRSDTVTQPTPEMRLAMQQAEVGDDVYCDDPTVIELEKYAAELIGKEAALFVPTGTMGNQLAIMTHTRNGDEIIAGASSHIIRYEGGAHARLSGVSAALIDNPNQYIYPEDVERKIRPHGDVHFPSTRLLCLENALCNGDVVPLEIINASCEVAHRNGLPVHLDGARIFNAAAALNVDARDIAAQVDSVMFCLSKGLCAPIGSMLCGTKEFIERARRNRKVLGGGMRQVGVLAACGLIALQQMTKRLHEDHANAQYLGEQLSAIPGITVDLQAIKINMVFWQTEIANFDSQAFVEYMYQQGIKVSGVSAGKYRFVTNNDVTRSDADKVIETIKAYIETITQ